MADLGAHDTGGEFEGGPQLNFDLGGGRWDMGEG